MLHQELELGRERALDISTGVEGNRLEARLHKAHNQTKGPLSEEISLPRGLFRSERSFRHGIVEVRALPLGTFKDSVRGPGWV